MIRLAVFDCDGTLVDSQVNICRAMEECFTTVRMAPPPRSQIRRVVGLSLNEAMRALLPEADDALHAAMADDYRRAFFAMRSNGALDPEPLYDGVAEAIARLDSAGWLLGVATGKSQRGLAAILAHHGLTDRFVTLQTADHHASKPDPAMLAAAIAEAGATPETTAMIGDTSFDMAMARAARTHAIGVGWGYHDADELIAAGAARVVDNAAELPEVLAVHLETL